MAGPELMIDSDENGNPVTAACSFCGEWMPNDGIEPLKPKEAVM
jgi:hypothetical protein